LNHLLLLTLELVEQAAWGFRVRLTARNDSAIKLFLPAPDVNGLQFGNTVTRQMADWYTGYFVSSAGGGFTLQSGESRAVEWRIRPCSVQPPEEQHLYTDFDYCRWCVELAPGRYLAWYQWRIDERYFHNDTHETLSSLGRAAAELGAVAWRGELLSNRVHVVHAAPDTGTHGDPQ
jgi:hypothetical protein